MPFEAGFPAGHERKSTAGTSVGMLVLGSRALGRKGLQVPVGCKNPSSHSRGTCLGRKPRRAGGRGRHHQVGGLLPCSRADSHQLLYSGACCLDLQTADCSSPGGRGTTYLLPFPDGASSSSVQMPCAVFQALLFPHGANYSVPCALGGIVPPKWTLSKQNQKRSLVREQASG